MVAVLVRAVVLPVGVVVHRASPALVVRDAITSLVRAESFMCAVAHVTCSAVVGHGVVHGGCGRSSCCSGS